MAAIAAIIEVPRTLETLPTTSEDEEFNVLAFKAWQRGSSSAELVENDWLSAEESILIPH